MAKYSNTKAKINEKITTNGAQAVTGIILNDVLQTMVDSLGADYQFGGLVQPGSSFTAGEQPVVFLATTPGTYTNFGGLVVADGEVALLVWSGSAWSKQTPDIATGTEVSQLGQEVDGLGQEVEQKTGKIQGEIDNLPAIEDNSGDFDVADKNGNIGMHLDENGLAVNEVLIKGPETETPVSPVVKSIKPNVENDGYYVTDDEDNCVMGYNDDGFDAAKISSHLLGLIKDGGLSLQESGGKITISNLGMDFRCAFHFTIDENINVADTESSIITFGTNAIKLHPSAISLLTSYFSNKLLTDVTTPQQQPKFNSGFNILGNVVAREQSLYKPIVGLPAFYMWLKGDFSQMENAPSVQDLEARSTVLSAMSNYSVVVENDRFSIINDGAEVFGTSLKSGSEYKSIDNLFAELQSGIGNDFGLMRCDMPFGMDCGELLQFGEIKLVGQYYQHLAMRSASFGYYYDSFPVPIYTKIDKSVHSAEMVRKGGYLYASVDGICYRVSDSSINDIEILTAKISVKDLYASNSLDDVEVFTDSDNKHHIVSNYSPAILGLQIHYLEDASATSKATYIGTAENAYSVGGTIYLQPTGMRKKVTSILASVSIGDSLSFNIDTNELYNATTNTLLGTASNGSGTPYESLTVSYGVNYQTSVGRVVKALETIRGKGYSFYTCSGLLSLIGKNDVPKKRSCFILKTDSMNGGGVYSSMMDKRNRTVFERMDVNYIIGSIIENEMLDTSKYPTTEDYRRLVYGATINQKDVISHSLTHDVQLESKNSLLVQWELQENTRLALEYGLQTRMYSWPGGVCSSENIYTQMRANGFVGSIGNETGYNVDATQPFRLHRNDFADRTNWNYFVNFLF